MTPTHHDHSADVAIAAMAALPPARPGLPRGAREGFDPHRTLPIRVELARQLRRRRTQFALAFMVALPLILTIAFAFGSDNAGPSTSSMIDLAESSGANFLLVTMFFSASFLLTVVVSLFFGDTVAAEASWSSLKYLLAMPVGRMRLLRQKFVAATIMSGLAMVLLAATAGLIGLVRYGTGPLTTPTGESFGGWVAAARIGIVVLALGVQLAWVAGLAFVMTVSTDAPLGAVGSAVLLSIFSQILDQITALGDLRNVLPTHYSFAWTGALSDPIDWSEMAQGAFVSLGYAAVLTAFAFFRFARKDITS